MKSTGQYQLLSDLYFCDCKQKFIDKRWYAKKSKKVAKILIQMCKICRYSKILADIVVTKL